GRVEIGRVAKECGAFGLSTGNLFEALELRRHGIKLPILLYASTLPCHAEVIVENRIIPTITDLEMARAFDRCAPEGYGVFVKVDCGLERVGIYAEEALPFIREVMKLPRVKVEGIYTFILGDDEYQQWQFPRFTTLLGKLEQAGVYIPTKLLATSGNLKYAEVHFNAVNPGRAVYGMYAVPGLDLRPAVRGIKARIVQIKECNLREQFADKVEFDLSQTKRIGILPTGWMDGLSRGYSNGGPVLVRGKRTFVAGNVHHVCSRVDLTNIPEARVGDEVVLFGRQGNEVITAEE
ncbi:unnamed protein product, partial [marine sediment metagenome]